MSDYVKQWHVEPAEFEKYGASDQGAASALFSAVVSTVRHILRILAQSIHPSDKELNNAIQIEYQRFYIWNDGFSTSSGELDSILNSSQYLRAAVLRLLYQWTHSITEVPKFTRGCDWGAVQNQVDHLEVVANKTKQVAEAAAEDQYSSFDSDDEGSQSTFSSNEESAEDIVKDLQTYMQSLEDLTPTLERPAEDFIEAEISRPIADLRGVSEEALSFVVNLRDRYPKSDPSLLRRLGELNLLRYQRLHKLYQKSLAMREVVDHPGEPQQEPRNEGQFLTGEPAVELSLGFGGASTFGYTESQLSSDFRATTFSNRSIFDHEVLQLSIKTNNNLYAESVTSFAASDVDNDHNTGHRNVPRLPLDHDYASPFFCQICGIELHTITNDKQWKKHVFTDLEPYTCLHQNCSASRKTFPSKHEWMEHDFHIHRITTIWRCKSCLESFSDDLGLQTHILSSHQRDFSTSQVKDLVAASAESAPRPIQTECCPFCDVDPLLSLRTFASHVGKHLQQISLAAIPLPDNGSDSESLKTDDSDGSNSFEVHGLRELSLSQRSKEKGRGFQHSAVDSPDIPPKLETKEERKANELMKNENPAYTTFRRNHDVDEYDVDFSNASNFAAMRFEDCVATISDELPLADRKTIREERDWLTIQSEIIRKRDDRMTTARTRKLINQLHGVPRTLYSLTVQFEKLIHPETVPIQVLWGLLYLNIRLSFDSESKLRFTCQWLTRLRRELEIFNRLLESYEQLEGSEANEAIIAMVDVYDPLLAVLTRSINFLRSSPTDSDLNENHAVFEEAINDHLVSIKETVTHLNDIAKFSSANRDQTQKSLQERHYLDLESVESGAFPMEMIPVIRNEEFFGRKEELRKIDEALRPKSLKPQGCRTYTLYGRRGVGKTEVALEYCYRSRLARTFDAVFWVICESPLTLRQSFADIAFKLDLPRANLRGNHEENQMAVLKWFKQTKRTWLLVFDNAVKEHLIKGYLPRGENGAILITSRKYYNFMKDDLRMGDTLKLFSADESFEFLCNVLGRAWKTLLDEKKIAQSEIVAAMQLLDRLVGLPLAIRQAAVLIKNEEIGGYTIEATFELFKHHSAILPEKRVGSRSDTYHALDTLWNMSFGVLSSNSRQLLQVLSFLSPDMTYIDLFLPRRQTALSDKLSFCRQLPNHNDAMSQPTLTNTVQPTPALEAALDSLLKAGLIRRDNRIISVHREVQEAMNYHSTQELQECFEAAVKIVHEAFPKRKRGSSQFEQWSICSQYIHSGVHLIWKFKEHNFDTTSPQLDGTTELIELVGNCAWYLYEISDYDTALDIIEIGYSACRKDLRDSLVYADLCNTAGACWYEKNDLEKGRAALEAALRIRRKELDKDDIEIAAVTHNRGNLESAAGNFDDAKELFDMALPIRHQQGDTAANQLALLYLCMGRNEFWKRNFNEAEKLYRMAETLFARTLGADKHFMAHVHYAYGNLAYRRDNYFAARRSYDECLRIALVDTPIHPITAAAYYSLGCVEYKLRNLMAAKSYLNKAKAIAEMRSPDRDDGTVARIIWMLSKVLREDPLTAAQAFNLRERAEATRDILIQQGQSAPTPEFDDEGNFIEPDEETLYDNLVPGFFR